MYRGFKLEKDYELEKLVRPYKEKGEKIWESKKNSIKNSIKDYIVGDKFIDCNKLQDDWFPQINADIFLSHSHADKDLVNGLVGWFKEKMDLDVFVDSNVWGYCDELLRDIDEDYCKHPNGTSFYYESRNYSTTHVHMMLATSLNKMIDKCECVIFLKTPNSINIDKVLEKDSCDIDEEETSSAWIYSEIMITSLIKRNIPKRLFTENLKKSFNAVNESFNPVYTINTEHLCEINYEILNMMNILTKNVNKTDYLDTLYKIKPNKELEILNE